MSDDNKPTPAADAFMEAGMNLLNADAQQPFQIAINEIHTSVPGDADLMHYNITFIAPKLLQGRVEAALGDLLTAILPMTKIIQKIRKH